MTNEKQFSEEDLNKWNEYFYPDSNVFKNKLNIHDYNELKEKDAELSFKRLVELREKPIEGNFDKEHFIKIHKYIFQDLYEWAGEYRTIYMSKNNSYFAPVDMIDLYLEDAFKLMKEEIKEVNSYQSMITFLTNYLVILLNIHPFREGNGRTIKEFLTELVENKSKELLNEEYTLNWGNTSSLKLEEAMVLARAFKGPIEQELMKALIKVENLEIER